MTEEKKTGVEAIIVEVLEDPDSSEKGDRDAPGTIDAEPSAPGKNPR